MLVKPKAIYLITAFTYFLLCSCGKNDIKQVDQVIAFKNTPPEIGRNVEIIYSDSGIKKAKMLTKKLIRKPDEQILEMPNGLHAYFFEKNGNPNAELKSRYAIRYLDKELTRVAGAVVVVTTKGDTLNTEEMFWDEKKNKVYSHKFVRVKKPDEIVFAEGFESDINFTRYKFFKIKATLMVEQK